jgi:hypothetical protein
MESWSSTVASIQGFRAPEELGGKMYHIAHAFRLKIPFVAVLILISSALFAPIHTASATSAEGSSSDAKVERIQRYVDQHRSEFGGIYLDSDVQTIYINVTSTAKPDSRRVALEMSKDLPPSEQPSSDGKSAWKVELHHVKYSTADLQDVARRITTEQPWVKLFSNVVAWSAIDQRNNIFTVAVTTLDQETRRLVERAFGDRVALVPGERLTFASKVTKVHGPVQVKKVDSGNKSTASAPQADDMPRVAPYPSRLLDGQPYYGGGRIYRIEASGDEVYIIQCTVAFAYSGPSMQTAGHCSPSGGTYWTQGYWDQGENTIYQTGNMGRVFAVQWGDNVGDGALMDGSTYSASVWTQLQSVQTVRGTSFPAQGQGVCFDGSFTNENCSGIIDTVGACADIFDPESNTFTHVCGLDFAHSSNGSRMCQQGDSGGPVYQRVPNGVKAAGIISATNTAGTTCAFADINIFDADFGGHVLFS